MTRIISGRRRAHWRVSAGACLLLVLGLACSKGEETPAAGETAAPGGSTATTERPAPAAPPAPAAAAKPAASDSHEALVERGRRVYQSNCIACHAPDPSVSGALGPDIAGSSRALIEARVLRAEYPPGYKPKRDTKIMIALPHLANDIDALYAYLSQGGAKAK